MKVIFFLLADMRFYPLEPYYVFRMEVQCKFVLRPPASKRFLMAMAALPLSGLDFTPVTPTRDQDETAPVIVVLHGLSGGEFVLRVFWV